MAATHSRPRRLIKRSILEELVRRQEAGIPLAAAIRQLQVDLSRPAVTTLVKYHKQGLYHNALYPDWLQTDPPNYLQQGSPDPSTFVQIAPTDWTFHGAFPDGYWEQTVHD